MAYKSETASTISANTGLSRAQEIRATLGDDSVEFDSRLIGDLTSATANMGGGVDNSVRGVVHYGSGAGVPTIEYITIATTGDATNFGNLTQKRKESGGCNNQTRGIWGGGKDNSAEDIIDYITIDTTGDATDFGDLTQSKQSMSACSGT